MVRLLNEGHSLNSFQFVKIIYSRTFKGIYGNCYILHWVENTARVRDLDAVTSQISFEAGPPGAEVGF